MEGDFLYLTKKHGGTLLAGKMTENQFWLLVEISPIHSEKVINALRDFLVFGYSRREAGERNDVSQGYLSSALGRFQKVNHTVSRLAPFYITKPRITYME
ncbi:adhesin biosynthesis transcription regulatory family protein [Escherichia coli]|uniref:adhesin biosynthesis transcription regulatory family protein n=1 Tax=Escherichia coli TaxID=562 RepID=UPI000DEA6C49|nr:adhesin biosynthesis transcription regulatory family protein [Escherichia coli]RBQ41294.1 transcriptional regulator [Escherichia coli]